VKNLSLKYKLFLKKFEALKEYRTVEYSDQTKIIDIREE